MKYIIFFLAFFYTISSFSQKCGYASITQDVKTISSKERIIDDYTPFHIVKGGKVAIMGDYNVVFAEQGTHVNIAGNYNTIHLRGGATSATSGNNNVIFVAMASSAHITGNNNRVYRDAGATINNMGSGNAISRHQGEGQAYGGNVLIKAPKKPAVEVKTPVQKPTIAKEPISTTSKAPAKPIRNIVEAKADESNKIIGTWIIDEMEYQDTQRKFHAIEAKGRFIFYKDGKGWMGMKLLNANLNIPGEGDFVWETSLTHVLLNKSTEKPQTWSRLINGKDKQKFTFLDKDGNRIMITVVRKA